MTRKEKVKEIFDRNGIFLVDEDLETIGQAIGETLEMIADEIEKEEPHATVTIGRYREASRNIEGEINEDNG